MEWESRKKRDSEAEKAGMEQVAGSLAVHRLRVQGKAGAGPSSSPQNRTGWTERLALPLQSSLHLRHVSRPPVLCPSSRHTSSASTKKTPQHRCPSRLVPRLFTLFSLTLFSRSFVLFNVLFLRLSFSSLRLRETLLLAVLWPECHCEQGRLKGRPRVKVSNQQKRLFDFLSLFLCRCFSRCGADCFFRRSLLLPATVIQRQSRSRQEREQISRCE